MQIDNLNRLLQYALFGLAIGLSCFQLYEGVSTRLGATFSRPIHLSWILILIFIRYPLALPRLPLLGRLIDLGCCVALCFAAFVIVSFNYAAIDHLLYGLDVKSYAAGLIIFFLCLEATRRAVGWEMAAIGAVFILYALLGHHLPDAIAHSGFSLERIIRFQAYTSEGLFGAPLGIAATAVFMFVLFGAYLESTGVGKFLIDLSYAAAGKYRGGPAKACVLASAGMGSISGSAIANAVAVGALTIPTMKQLGYTPEQAAGIEASASTGGQIMPPIMGAGAFIMADLTNTAYREIVFISIAPALLYFISVLLYVHLMACKLGLKGLDKRPNAWLVLRQGFHFLLPLALIVTLLMLGYSPTLVGAIGSAAILLSCLLRPHSRIHPVIVIDGLKRGALMMLPISAACATAGIVVGVIGQTGLGLQFTEFVISLSDGQLWLALLLVGASALILGMGLPVTAAYIILAVMAAPALQSMGVPLLVAHMAIFWLSQTSNITPPVALAAFAAAGVANARPQASAIEAMKLSNAYFIVPVLMLYTDLLFLPHVSTGYFLIAFLCGLAAIVSLAFAIERYAHQPLMRFERLLFFTVTLLVLHHSLTTSIIAVGLFIVIYTLHRLQWLGWISSGR